MCLAQGPQRSDAGEARTRGPSVSSKISVGAKSQILSSVAPPRKKNLVTIFSQGHVLGPWKPMFY